MTAKHRIWLDIIVVLLYWAAFNFYIYELTMGGFSERKTSLLYYYITLGILLFALSDWKFGFVSNVHEQFNLLCFLSVCWNFIFIIIVRHDFINQLEAPQLFYTFNGMFIAVTICIVRNLKKYGYF